ncbi:MAG TPA: nucleotidyltransferase family protein, partial [Thermoanaerobaculia bacterium]|nr:nucleotidyltransferase family protein [Thermoanaerobaculia bacterium]
GGGAEGQGVGAVSESGFREILHRRVAERVAGMPEPEAVEWIAGHGLLSMAACAALPAGVRERLRDHARGVVAHNLLAVARFRDVVAALDGIPVCPLKGIHLLDTVYLDDPGSRPLADVDLLVPAGRLEDAVARLEDALGLAELPGSRRLRRIYPERILVERSFVLELHGRLGYKHGWASTWSDLAPVPARVHGCPVHALDRETTLVHLVTHLVKHEPFSRLVWVEDVLRWVASEVNSDRALERARRVGGLRSFVAGVRALRWLAGEDFLPGVPAGVGGPGQRLLLVNERRLWGALRGGRLPDPVAAGSARSRIGSALSALLLADGPRHAVRIVGVKGAELLLRRRAPTGSPPASAGKVEQ